MELAILNKNKTDKLLSQLVIFLLKTKEFDKIILSD